MVSARIGVASSKEKKSTGVVKGVRGKTESERERESFCEKSHESHGVVLLLC